MRFERPVAFTFIGMLYYIYHFTNHVSIYEEWCSMKYKLGLPFDNMNATIDKQSDSIRMMYRAIFV